MSKYTMVRISKATHARLTALRDQLAEEYAAGRAKLPDHQAEHVSLDFFIGVLMDRVQEHRQRAKRQRAKAKKV